MKQDKTAWQKGQTQNNSVKDSFEKCCFIVKDSGAQSDQAHCAGFFSQAHYNIHCGFLILLYIRSTHASTRPCSYAYRAWSMHAKAYERPPISYVHNCSLNSRTAHTQVFTRSQAIHIHLQFYLMNLQLI